MHTITQAGLKKRQTLPVLFSQLWRGRVANLFFHGNAGNISHRLDSLRIFHDLSYSTLIIDYRGYGQSTGRTTENSTYRDTEAAWQYLTATRGVLASDIVLFGRSLGAAVATKLATKQMPRALTLESTFTSVPDVAAKLYPYLPVRMLSRLRYDTHKALHDVTCPVLVVHSADDEIIPYRHGQALYAIANQPKALLTISGSHNEGFVESGRACTDGLVDFLAQHPVARDQ